MRKPWATGVSRRALVIGAPALAAGLLVAPRLGRAAGVDAEALRLGDHGASTRFVLELSGPVTWRTFPLAQPDRLIIDVPAMGYRFASLPGNIGHVRAVRHGHLSDGTARMVLDLARPALVDKDFLLEPRDGHGWRLVIDMVPVEEAEFLASVGRVLAPVAPASLTPEPSTRLAATRPQPAAAQGGDSSAPDSSGPTMAVPPLHPKPEITADAAAAVLPSPPGAALAPNPIPGPTAPLAPTALAALAADQTGPLIAAQDAAGGIGLHTPVPILTHEGLTMVRLADGRRVPVPLVKPPPPAAPQPLAQRPVIVLDPGHGGRDPGATGLSGTHEKDITLAMGRELKRKLEATGRYKVVLTRNRDTAIRLRNRVALGRQAGGTLFISLHADALKDHRVRGLSVYTLSEKASDAEAAALAERENKVDILLGIDLSHESPDVATILIDLAQRDTKNNSVLFANTLIKNLPGDVRQLNKPHRSAGFAVLKAPDVPSVLVEMGFLSNRTDEKLLRTPAYRAKLAEALIASIDDFLALQQQRAWRL